MKEGKLNYFFLFTNFKLQFSNIRENFYSEMFNPNLCVIQFQNVPINVFINFDTFSVTKYYTIHEISPLPNLCCEIVELMQLAISVGQLHQLASCFIDDFEEPQMIDN